MYFTETPSLREIEKAMKMIPNFTPRGHGVVILCKHEFAEKSCIGDSQKEILARTVSRINNPLFQKRFQKYINESETIPMNFRNSKHSISFTDTIRKKNKKDYALMWGVYCGKPLNDMPQTIQLILKVCSLPESVKTATLCFAPPKIYTLVLIISQSATSQTHS